MWSQSAAMKRHLNSNSLTFSRPKTRAHCQANKTGQLRFSSLKSRLFVPYSCPCPIPVPIPIPFPFPFRFPSDRHLSFFGDWGALVVGSVSVSKSKLDKRRERTIMPYLLAFLGALKWILIEPKKTTAMDDQSRFAAPTIDGAGNMPGQSSMKSTNVWTNRKTKRWFFPLCCFCN